MINCHNVIKVIIKMKSHNKNEYNNKSFYFILFILLFKSNYILASNVNVIYEWTDNNDVISQYVLDNKDIIKRHANFAFKKSFQYKDYIKKISKELNVPEEVYIIAAIESSFNPHARSKAGAVGMWQFMLPTSKDMGLVVNKKNDERKNWKKSTYAGIKYIKYLAEVHFNGDYELAILAYNAGLGRVKKAIYKNQTADVWTIIQDKTIFPKESREYLPKFISFVHYFKYLEKH